MELTIDNAVVMADEFVAGIAPFPTNQFSGRGIVICAGGFRYSTCAWVLIRMLRDLGCRLPIQVWYVGERERSNEWVKAVQPFGVECVDAQLVAQRHPHPHLQGWSLKPYAMLHCPFEEALLLDADNVPVINPEFLFDSEPYHRTGAVFWPDGYRATPDRDYWRIFGVDYRDEVEQESGQVLVNKRRCWRELNLCEWYNRNGNSFFYRWVYGDKDTFRLAWHRLGTAFAIPGRGLSHIPYTLCQHDFSGRRLFQHRCKDKWSLAGNRHAQGFVHEDRCFKFLQELRNLLPPLTVLAPHLTAADRELMCQLSKRRFTLVRPGHNQWPVMFRSDGTLAQGATQHVSYWWADNTTHDRGSPELVVANCDGELTARLACDDDGCWIGTGQRTPIELHPLPAYPRSIG